MLDDELETAEVPPELDVELETAEVPPELDVELETAEGPPELDVAPEDSEEPLERPLDACELERLLDAVWLAEPDGALEPAAPDDPDAPPFEAPGPESLEPHAQHMVVATEMTRKRRARTGRSYLVTTPAPDCEGVTTARSSEGRGDFPSPERIARSSPTP